MNPSSKNNFWKIAAGASAVLVGFLILVVLINYLGILPQKNNKASSQNLSGAGGKTVFTCPIDDSPCPKADSITKSSAIENFKGLGYKDLRPGTDILAIEGGKYNVKETAQGASAEDVNIYITTDQKLTFGYRFKGSTNLKGKGSVAAGQPIGTLNGGSKGGTSFGGDYNLILSIKDLNSQKFLELTSSEDGILTKE